MPFHRLRAIAILFSSASLGAACGVAPAAAAPVLLVSIDGLHPGYVLDADRYGLEIPNLRRYVREGSHARGVVGVVPTVTYPSHTTLVTGVHPAQHGITANTPFDPYSRNQEGWFWYAEDIRSRTLWQAAQEAGLSTAALNWPVTVGDPAIQWLLPEFWRTSQPDDQKLLRALSRPEGYLAALEKDLGAFVDGNVDTLDSDRIRTRFAVRMLAGQSPQFMAVHLVALDGTEHREGPFGRGAFATLEALDGMLGELETAALASHPATVLVVVSDHGFIATHTAVNLRTEFVKAGLIALQPEAPDTAPAVAGWKAQLWSSGPTAVVKLADPQDSATRNLVAELLSRLEAEPKNGIARVLTREQIGAAGGFPDGDLLIEFAPGFYLGAALKGALLVPAPSRGTHGYLPDRPEMNASFFVRGQGVGHHDLGLVDMRSIAPTLARLLEVRWNETGHPALDVDRDVGRSR